MNFNARGLKVARLDDFIPATILKYKHFTVVHVYRLVNRIVNTNLKYIIEGVVAVHVAYVLISATQLKDAKRIVVSRLL